MALSSVFMVQDEGKGIKFVDIRYKDKKAHLILLCACEIKLCQVSQNFISSMSYFKMLICLLFIFLTAAGDGWALSWRVLHHLQASKAWQTWYWCHSFFPIYSPEIKKKNMNKTCLKLLSVIFIDLS